MWLSRLEIENIRNIERAELAPANGYNLITGSNGSGKSSLLEAIQCLSTGKSFRTLRKQPLIRSGAERAIVYGQLITQNSLFHVGLMKRLDGATLARIDGRNLEGQAELATLLPVIGISPESEDIVGDGSKARQAYLDWTLFHVEPNFRECWRSYRRALFQRNSALRGKLDTPTIKSWNASLITLGEQLDHWRRNTFSRLHLLIEKILIELLPESAISFSYRQGWPKELTLAQALESTLDVDRKMGFTHCGPHRADIAIRGPLGVIGHTLSRGQRKVTALSLKISQAQDYQQQTGCEPVIYIDDLPSELDAANRNKILQHLLKLNSQLFITAISEADMPMREYRPLALFHVEQGRVTNVV